MKFQLISYFLLRHSAQGSEDKLKSNRLSINTNNKSNCVIDEKNLTFKSHKRKRSRKTKEYKNYYEDNSDCSVTLDCGISITLRQSY